MSVAPVTEQMVAESVQKDKFSQTESMIFRAKPQKLMEVLMGWGLGLCWVMYSSFPSINKDWS